MTAKGICRGGSVFIALSTYDSKLRSQILHFIIVIDPIRSIYIFGASTSFYILSVWCSTFSIQVIFIDTSERV